MAGERKARRIGDLGKVITGKTPSTAIAANFGGEYPFITIPDMDGRRDISATARTLSELGAKALRSCRLPVGAVMMSCIATIGKCGITTRPSFTNQQINSVICGEYVDPKFLFYCFTQLGHALEATGGGGSVYTNVSKSRFEDIEVTLPPLPEQKAIAHILGTLDDKIELNRRVNATLEAMARALFRSWFVDFLPVRANMDRSTQTGDPVRLPAEASAQAGAKLDLPARSAQAGGRQPAGLDAATAALFPVHFQDSLLGHIPQGWRVKSIYEIADVIYGAPFASALFNSHKIGKPLVRIRDLYDENPANFTTEILPKGYLLKPGDIAVGMDGEFRAHLWGGVESWLNQRVCVFAPKHGYSAAFVRNSIFALLAQVESTETATTVIHLGKNDIDRFTVIVPDSQVVDAFNQICQPWYDRIVANKQQSRTLATLRDALLPKLLSGELRVDNLKQVAEEVI